MDSRTYRKIRKLIRNPRQYWEDSQIKKFIFGSNQKNNNTQPDTINNSKMPPIANNLTHTPLQNQTLQSYILKPPSNSNTNTKKQIILYCNTIYDINIEITSLQGTALSRDNLLHLKQSEIDNLIELRIKESTDVTQFKQKNYLSFELSDNFTYKVSEQSIFQALSQEQRTFFSNFKFILIINPKSNFCYAIHTCSFKPRLCVVITEKDCLKNLNKLYIDDLFISKDLIETDDLLHNFRNINIITNDAEDIYQALRDRFRETSTKDYNVFIPIKRDSQSAPIIKQENDYKDYDILLSTKETNTREFSCFRDYIENLELKELYIREEIVLRYKSLLKYSLFKDSFATFLSFASLDGYKFYEID